MPKDWGWNKIEIYRGKYFFQSKSDKVCWVNLNKTKEKGKEKFLISTCSVGSEREKTLYFEHL